MTSPRSDPPTVRATPRHALGSRPQRRAGGGHGALHGDVAGHRAPGAVASRGTRRQLSTATRPGAFDRRRVWPWVVGGVCAVALAVSVANPGDDDVTAPTSAPQPGAARVPTGAEPTRADATGTGPAGAERTGGARPTGAAPTRAAPTRAAPTRAAPTGAVRSVGASGETIHRGSDDEVVLIDKEPGAAVVRFDCPSCTSNTILRSNGSEALLVNAIGAYTGRHVIDARRGSATSTLEVRARGAWTITVSPGLGSALTSDGAPVSGLGDDVVLVEAGTTRAQITTTGGGGFAVWTHPLSGSGGSSLAATGRGDFDGTIRLTAPVVVEVRSTGRWTIAPY